MAAESWLIPVLMTLLPQLLSLLTSAGGQEATSTTTTEATPTGYQSPMLGLMDPLMAQLLMENLGLYSGAGMPGGAGWGKSSGTIQSLLALLGEEWPTLMGQYKGAPKGLSISGLSSL